MRNGDSPTSAVAFGDAIARLHRRLGGDPSAARDVGAWATRAWQATQDGHVCVRVPEGDRGPERAALSASPAVTADPRRRPAALVLDLGALYLQRWWAAETGLASALAALDVPDAACAPDSLERVLEPLFPGVPADDGQRVAARAGLERRLAVITGGPGTGKTTTLARLIVAFLRARPGARVAYAAPTGKAAARLAQSLAAQMPALDPGGDLAASLPAGGSTVHRLLNGVDAAGRLRFDLVIVDEASMLDVVVASRLAAAMPPTARLVLAGDRDQLASVEAGAVFSELCASGVRGLARLDRNYRQAEAPAIASLATALRDADPQRVRDSLSAVRAAAPRDAAQIAEAALCAYAPALEAVAARRPPEAVLSAWDRHRVLCALRGGPLGAAAINAAIAVGVRRAVGAPPSAAWYPGRLVMVGRNEPDLGLFNGDVGVCLPAIGGRGFEVAFPVAGEVRRLPVAQMPPCEDAFAITVHKSQGSEFDTVAVVPAAAGHPLNTRELVYTAVTRARSALTLWAEPDAIVAASTQRTTRHGLLADRLAAR